VTFLDACDLGLVVFCAVEFNVQNSGKGREL
jgi:hypothetical protein